MFAENAPRDLSSLPRINIVGVITIAGELIFPAFLKSALHKSPRRPKIARRECLSDAFNDDVGKLANKN